MAWWNLLFSQPLQCFRILAGGEDVEEILCLEPDVRVRNHALAVTLEVDDDSLPHAGHIPDFLSLQNGTTSHRHFHNISFFLTGLIGLGGEGFLEEGIVDGLALQELRRNVGHCASQGQGHEVAEVAGHFQDEEGAGDGGADAGSKEGHHADDDDIGRIDFIDEIQGHQHIGLHAPQKGADDEKGQEEAAGHAAAIADESENIFPEKKEQQEGKAVETARRQLVHQRIAAAQHLGKEESQKAGGKEGKKDFYILVFENGKIIKAAGMKKAVVEENACKTGGNGNEHHQPQMLCGHGHQVDEMETGASSEEEMGDNGGGDGAGHGGQEHGTGEISVQFFQRKHHARQGRIESGRQTGTGAAGDEVALFHAGAAQETGNPLACHGADLDGRPLPSQGKTGADAQGTGNDFHPENAEPFHFIQPQDDPLHLGNAGASRHGGIETHAVQEKSRHHKGRSPQKKGNEIFLRRRRNEKGIVHKNAKRLRLSQKETEKADAEPAENADEYAFYKQTEAEFMPVIQGNIGFKELPA